MSFNMELSSSGISADLSRVSSSLKQRAKGCSTNNADPALFIPGQGHSVVGAVGAKDWAGGFLDLKADLQDDRFIGNEPLTLEARAGYLGEYSSFCWAPVVLGARESLRLTFKIIMKIIKQLT